MERDDDSAPKLRERQKRLQIEVSKPTLGFVGQPLAAHFNPFPRLLAETREKLDKAIQRDDVLAQKALASKVGAGGGGVRSGEIRSTKADKHWRNNAMAAAKEILKEQPDLPTGQLATEVIFKIDYPGDHSNVAKYLRKQFENSTLKRPPL